MSKSAFWLCSLWGCQYVDQKVNTRWPKFGIWKYRLSALCGYFYGFQNPSGDSGMLYIGKKAEKLLNPWAPMFVVSSLREIWRIYAHTCAYSRAYDAYMHIFRRIFFCVHAYFYIFFFICAYMRIYASTCTNMHAYLCTNMQMGRFHIYVHV